MRFASQESVKQEGMGARAATVAHCDASYYVEQNSLTCATKASM